ncbi:hypothetical protein LX83_006937 [Goodfellowiella coeruleoviolacea]|uniref:Uncharacterized protein n=1 Tax=Goodfellowiella coeruleoviolacea TaxID=334858 RepID=A0AAE3GML1_9PSEU|nr:hypothetical protein [Goodfellowiella coeruleoviolacea]
MAEPYRDSDPLPESPGDSLRSSTSDSGAGAGVLRPVLWLVLVVSAAGNAVFSSLDDTVLVGIGLGLVTLGCAVALAVHHYRRRRG